MLNKFKIVKSEQVPKGMYLLIDEFEADDFIEEEDGPLPTCYTEIGLVYNHIESGELLCDFLESEYSFSSSDFIELAELLRTFKAELSTVDKELNS